MRPMLTGPKEKKYITGAISGFDWVERCWDGRGLEQTLIMMLILLVSEGGEFVRPLSKLQPKVKV